MTERIQIDQVHSEAYRRQIRVAQEARTAAEVAGLDDRLIELVNIRASQINGCAACLVVHVREAEKLGETLRRLGVISVWREAGPLFAEHERAALELTEIVTNLPERDAMDASYARVLAVLSPEQASAVIWLTIAINSFNRISIMADHLTRSEVARSRREAGK